MSVISNPPMWAKLLRRVRKEIITRLYPRQSEFGPKGDREKDYGPMMMLVFITKVC